MNSAVPCSAMRTGGNFTIRSRVCAELARIARCLRAAHFFAENRRVFEAADAVENCDREGFLDVVRRSGDSSFKYLQNLYSPAAPEQQGLPLAPCAQR